MSDLIVRSARASDSEAFIAERTTEPVGFVSLFRGYAGWRGWIRIELFVEEGRPALRFYESIGMRDLHHRHQRHSPTGASALMLGSEWFLYRRTCSHGPVSGA